MITLQSCKLINCYASQALGFSLPLNAIQISLWSFFSNSFCRSWEPFNNTVGINETLGLRLFVSSPCIARSSPLKKEPENCYFRPKSLLHLLHNLPLSAFRALQNILPIYIQFVWARFPCGFGVHVVFYHASNQWN